MDSGNSGSLQSYSSGGDDHDQYDSRAAESFSALFTPPSVVPPLHPPQTAPFDPFSSYLQIQNPNSPFWPRGTNPRSEPYNNPGDDVMSSAGIIASVQEIPGGVVTAASALDNRTQQHQMNQTARNPRKRSRAASRRAPTTVLTTDTTNFRAMVQEFTGIPAPPFTSHQPLYLRRPFPLKLQSPPLLSVSSASTNTAASGSTPALRYPLPTLNSNIFNALNPYLTSNFLQTSHTFPFSSSFLGAKNQASFQIPSVVCDIPSGGAGIVPQHLVPSDHTETRKDHDISHDWRNNAAGPEEVNRHEAQRRQLVNDDYDFSRDSRTGSSTAPATSDFPGRMGPENMGTKASEGTLESWISSSE